LGNFRHAVKRISQPPQFSLPKTLPGRSSTVWCNCALRDLLRNRGRSPEMERKGKRGKAEAPSH